MKGIEQSIGKGEVRSSILRGSTIIFNRLADIQAYWLEH